MGLRPSQLIDSSCCRADRDTHELVTADLHHQNSFGTASSGSNASLPYVRATSSVNLPDTYAKVPTSPPASRTTTPLCRRGSGNSLSTSSKRGLLGNCLNMSSQEGADEPWEMPPSGVEDEIDGASINSDDFFDVQEFNHVDVRLDDYLRGTGEKNETHRWLQPYDHSWKVRGKTYLKDKVKIEESKQLATLLCVDLCFSEKEIHAMTMHPNSAYSQYRKAGNADFLFCVNWRCAPMHVAVLFAISKDQLDSYPLLKKMTKMTDTERNARLKVIPQCIEGPWLARAAVGTTPVIIGKKLDTEWYSGSDFLEVSINVYSSTAAKKMMNVVCGAAKKLVIDVAYVLEGQAEEELPERLLGAFRVIRTDITKLRHL